MAALVTDTFTDTNGVLLENHTGEVGATWTKHPSFSGSVTIQTNEASLASGSSVYYASGVPATAEYDVEFVIKTGITGSNQMGVAGRHSTSVDTSYLAFLESSVAITLYRGESGVFTGLGSYSGSTWVSGDKITLKILDATKKVFKNDVEIISSTDNVVTAAGRPAFRCTGTIAFDSYSAVEAGATFVPRQGLTLNQAIKRAGDF